MTCLTAIGNRVHHSERLDNFVHHTTACVLNQTPTITSELFTGPYTRFGCLPKVLTGPVSPYEKPRALESRHDEKIFHFQTVGAFQDAP
jgi:hypothetical protein